MVGRGRFSSGAPLPQTRRLARDHACDLAIPNGPGIGNVVVYTRLVEELSFHLGRPLRLLTAPLSPKRGRRTPAMPYPIWHASPFVSEIVDADAIDRRIMPLLIQEKDDLCQFSHVMDNLCAVFNLRPRRLKGSLFLAKGEMVTGLRALEELPRPVVVLHPFGKTSSPKGSRWYLSGWEKLAARWERDVSFVQLGLKGTEEKGLGVLYPDADVRQAMAIIWAADAFIGFDSGLAHIATAFDKPCVVMWDAVHKEPLETAKEPGFASAHVLRWGYPQNRNLALLGERDDEICELTGDFLESLLHSLDRKVYVAGVDSDS